MIKINLLCLGIDLPGKLQNTRLAMVTNPLGDGIIVIGGTAGQDELHELICLVDHCFWYKMEQVLKVKRTDFVAMLIPDSLANCTNPN